MYNKIILIILISLLFIGRIYTQGTSQQLPKIIPPSPNVAALQRFGDIPVSAYTGVPDISIPFFEIKAGNVSIPISVRYHASGIKIADEASRVGLGWALEAGGVISRTILGEDDFSANFSYHTTSIEDVVSGSKDFPNSDFIIQRECGIAVNNLPNLKTNLNLGYNYQPDVYNFNFLNFAGKFFLKRNKEVILSKKEKLKIRCVDDLANSWEITTPDGNKFLFAEYETYAESGASPNSPLIQKSAWYLTSIITQNGETITFSYLTDQNYLKPVGSLYESTNPNVLPTETLSTNGSSAPFPSIKIVSPGKQYKNVYLDQIVFKTGKLKFLYSTDRIDVSSDRKLTNVQIYSKNTAGTFDLFKQWELMYSYFEGTNTSSFESSTGNISKRLRLDSLREKNALNVPNPSYVFTYNNLGISDAVNLPTKTSYSRDHWGYYNGKNNTSLIPVYSPGNAPNNPVLSYIGIQGENRDPNPNYNQIFILNEIKYPTGGRTTFEYETNDYDVQKSMVNDRTDLGSVPEAVDKEPSKSYTNPVGQVPTTADIPNQLMDLTDLYIPPTQTKAKVELTAFFRFASNTLPQGCNIGQSKIKMALVREDGSYAGESSLVDHLSNTSKPMTICDNSSGTNGMTFLQDYDLSPGKYYWRLKVADNYTDLIFAKVTIKYKGIKSVQPIEYYGELLVNASFGGGLRIKRVSDYDKVTAIPKITRYEYHTIKDGKRYSNGKRMARPMYSYFDDSWNSLTIGGATHFYRFEHLIRESDSNIPLNSSATGCAVGYDAVTIFYGENGENGNVKYEFENITDLIWDYTEQNLINAQTVKVPRKPPAFCSISNPTNGNVKRQVFYKNGSLSPVKEIVNTYDDLLGNNYPVWYGIEKRNFSGPNMRQCPYRIYLYPTSVEGRKLLASSTITEDGVSKTVSYTYNNSTHLQLVSTEESNSKGDKIITGSTYPLDYANVDADAAILQMKDAKFMHASVVMQNKSIKKAGSSTSTVISSKINKFQTSSSTVADSKITIKEIAMLETSAGITAPVYRPITNTFPSGYFSKISFDKYDEQGNICQVHKTDDVNNSYIWDNDKAYPIAEAVNAKVTNIFHTSFEDIEGNLDNDSKTGKKSKTGGYSKSLSGLTNGSYVLSWWEKTGSVWGFKTNTISVSNSSYTISLSNQVDEIRFYPRDAQMVTYTYNAFGMTSLCDANNKISTYQYDGFGRLRLMKDQDGKVLKVYDYKYSH